MRDIEKLSSKFVLMLFPEKVRILLFKIFAVLASLAATYHGIAIFYNVDESPIWRHALFVMVNLFCVCGMLKRPKYFVYIIGLILVQQYYSHGTYMLNLWEQKKQIHWISVVDLLLLPIALICLIEDYKMRRKKE